MTGFCHIKVLTKNFKRKKMDFTSPSAPVDSLDGLLFRMSPDVPLAPRLTRSVSLTVDTSSPRITGRLLPSPAAAGVPPPIPPASRVNRRIVHAGGRQRLKSIAFTVYPGAVPADNCKDDILSFFEARSLKFGIGGLETCPDTGRLHFQCYAQFQNSVSSDAIRLSPLWVKYRFHFEKANGSPLQNFTYCSKDGDFFEVGTRPIAGHLRGIEYHLETLNELAIEFARTPSVPRLTVDLMLNVLEELNDDLDLLSNEFN